MLIQQKLGKLEDVEIAGRAVAYIQLQWFETDKRILHKQTNTGVDLTLKFMNESPALTQDDVLYEDYQMVIAVEIAPCEVIAIRPRNALEIASVCYEIGNKHLPLFYQDQELLVAFEAPLFRLMVASGYQVEQSRRKLLHPLRTTVQPHLSTGGETLFSKIMRLTNPS